MPPADWSAGLGGVCGAGGPRPNCLMGAARAAAIAMFPDYLHAPGPSSPRRYCHCAWLPAPSPLGREFGQGFIKKSVSCCSPHWPPAGNLGFFPVSGTPQALMCLCMPMHAPGRGHAPPHPSAAPGPAEGPECSPHPHLPLPPAPSASPAGVRGWRATPPLCCLPLSSVPLLGGLCPSHPP